MRKLIILIGILALIVWAASPYVTLRKQQKDVARLEAKLESLRADNERLREDIKRFSDPKYIEVLARDKLGLVKDGERAFLVVDDPKKKSPPDDDDASPDAGSSPSKGGKKTAQKDPDQPGTLDQILRFFGLTQE